MAKGNRLATIGAADRVLLAGKLFMKEILDARFAIIVDGLLMRGLRTRAAGVGSCWGHGVKDWMASTRRDWRRRVMVSLGLGLENDTRHWLLDFVAWLYIST